MQLQQMGLIEASQLWKYLDTPDIQGWRAQARLNEEQAEREHDLLKQGQPINHDGWEQAQGILQQGINPETQQPFQSPEEARQFYIKQCTQIHNWDDNDTHYRVHSEFMKTLQYEQLDPQIQDWFEAHLDATYTRMMMYNQPPPNVKANLNIHSTLGPTATAEVLNRAGVYNVTPQDTAEMPLDTMVQEDRDLPNEEFGPYPPEKPTGASENAAQARNLDKQPTKKA